MSETDEEKAKRTAGFLKYGIDRLESNIALVDNKASILIAVIAGLMAALTFVVEKVLWAKFSPASIRMVSYPVFVLMLLWLLIVLFLLLWTLRPDRYPLGRRARLVLLKEDLYSLLWPPGDFLRHPEKQPGDLQKYGEAIQALPEAARMDFEHTHFAAFQLVSRKQRHYRRAMWLLRCWVVFLGVLVVFTGLVWTVLAIRPG